MRLFANDGEIEKEYFSPVLVQANLARRSICRAVEGLGETMVAIPADKLLSASAKEFATADLQDGAADDAPHKERLEFVYDVLERYELVRTEAAKLRSFCSCMTRIHMLAHSGRGGLGGRGRKENVAPRNGGAAAAAPGAGRPGGGYWRTV
jgi:hypothetical protein